MLFLRHDFFVLGWAWALPFWDACGLLQIFVNMGEASFGLVYSRL